MGFDFETVYGLAVGSDGDETLSAEDITRKGYDGDTDNESHNDPSMRKIVVVEAYMHMDIEGTGVPRLYQFVTAGTNYTILDYEPCDMVPYCVFECDPEPHAFFGHAPVEYIIDDQTASSSLLRGIIDNIHMSNTPRLAYDPELAKTEDILNNEIGALIRTKGLPGNAILPLGVPFMAHQTLPAMQYFDEQIDAKTGVSRSMSGMAADTLQNATARGVQAAVEAQSAAMELMARHLAEGGMTDVFRKIHRIIRQRAPADEVMMINGSFVPVDPSSWSADMDVKVNVGLGTNQREERMAMLQAVKMDQDAILQTYGPQNPFVTLTQARNVRADLMEMSGLHDATRYYQPMTPEIEQQVMQSMAAQSQGQQGGDPNAAFLQAEQMKAQQRAQSDQMKYTLEAQKVAMQDDRERDKMAQDRVMEAIKLLGEYGLKVDQQAIQAEQAAQRQFGNQPR